MIISADTEAGADIIRKQKILQMKHSVKKFFLIIAIPLASFSCQNNTAEKKRYEQELKAESDSLTTVAQQILMKNLTAAIQKNGAEYAVDFCNVQAVPLTHSAAENTNAFIQRISDKNRNPDNALKTQTDKDIFEYFRKFETLKDSLVSENNKYVYYKRINLAMTTCMQCHGAAENIEPKVLARIDQHYPDDKARNYNLNEFRGLWKVTYEEKQ